MTNKTFWKTVRPFLSNKGTHDNCNHNIILDENGELLKDNRDISEILNNLNKRHGPLYVSEGEGGVAILGTCRHFSEE